MTDLDFEQSLVCCLKMWRKRAQSTSSERPSHDQQTAGEGRSRDRGSQLLVDRVRFFHIQQQMRDSSQSMTDPF